MRGLTVPVAPALVLGVIVNVLARVVRNVHDPVGQVRQLLGDAGPYLEIIAAQDSLVVCLLGRRNRAVALGIRYVVITTAGDNQGHQRQRGDLRARAQ